MNLYVTIMYQTQQQYQNNSNNELVLSLGFSHKDFFVYPIGQIIEFDSPAALLGKPDSAFASVGPGIIIYIRVYIDTHLF